MSRFALVVIGYNRLNGIKRLLNSLRKANYDEEIDLIISIDHSGTDIVEKYAKEFEWPNGKKKVVTYPERNGLRKHILRCGDFTQEYDAIAVFEDDLVVSPGFFQYMKETVEKYSSDPQIAGISLYQHLYNVNASVLFEPAYSEYDVYFMQFAQSWGQVWMKDAWNSFKCWYDKNKDSFEQSNIIPDSVQKWPESSWLKYHIKYCVEQDKYFVYPYRSLTTCFSDVGQHNSTHRNLFQVPIQYGEKHDYQLPSFEIAPVKYDAFFERVLERDSFLCGIKSSEITFDLYHTKKNTEKRYLVSTRVLPFEAVKSFGLELRPVEMNVLMGIPGNNIFLYDVHSPKTGVSIKKLMSNDEFTYRWRLDGKTKLLFNKLKANILSRFMK